MPRFLTALLGAAAYAATPAFGLPPESDLPEGYGPALVDTADEAFPPESELPRGAEAAAADPEDPVIGGRDKRDLWLRLNAHGHSAPIRVARFLPGGQKLCTAGDDKTVVVWSRGDRADSWRHERTIRWQIQRGSRGRIYAMAASKSLLAIAGEGAMGGTGEIALVDPNTGDFVATLFDEELGHRQVVVSLDLVETDAGPMVASQSMDGRTLTWRQDDQGLWRATELRPDDRGEGLAGRVADRLTAARTFSDIVVWDERRVIVPLHELSRSGAVGWRLHTITIGAASRKPLGGRSGPLHRSSLVAMASDRTRERLVSVDAAGSLYAWDLRKEPAGVTRLKRGRAGSPVSLSLSADGSTLAIGIAGGAQGAGSVEVWDLTSLRRPKLVAAHKASAPVLAAAVSDDSAEIAFGDAAAVVTRSGGGTLAGQRLAGAIEMPLRVAFPIEKPYYRIGIGDDLSVDDRAIRRVFDTDRLRLVRTDKESAEKFLPADWGQGDWTVDESTVDGQRRWLFKQRGIQRAELPLDETTTGAFRSACWIPGRDLGSPPMVAIGTSAGEIFLVRVAAKGRAPVVRRFRGHGSGVMSLAVSRDLRWLASGAADGTVRVWPVQGTLNATPLENRWGVGLEVDADGALIAASIRESGPLYQRGLRRGDEIVACEWLEGGQRVVERDAARLLTALTEAPWNRVVAFEVRTGRQPTRHFQMRPAWRQTVSLTCDDSGEWAYWSPSGYYDASFEGHRLFGWQINRGMTQAPAFFLAERFRGVLERPAVMSRLLREGSIEAAFRATQAAAPTAPADAVFVAAALRPEVEIVSPAPGEFLTAGLDGNTLVARIRTPLGERLVAPKAFAGGVVAPPGRLVEQSQVGGQEVHTYEWRLAVSRDEQTLVQVIAATESEIAGTAERLYPTRGAEPPRKPRLFVLAVAVDENRDARIPRLRNAVAKTEQVVDRLQQNAKAIYRVNATLLRNGQATRRAWARATEEIASQLSNDPSADDLVIIYLSGHGVQDVERDQYHFIAADADYAEVMAGGFSSCLSFDDLAQISGVSCRKLVILDTCHAGAIQPMRHREMKSAVRALQRDMVITVAASDGAEEAVEGRFATRLIQALEGAADRDGDADGVVRLNEVVAYVRRTVTADSLRDGVLQTPSAGPLELLPYANPPLTISGSRAARLAPGLRGESETR